MAFYPCSCRFKREKKLQFRNDDVGTVLPSLESCHSICHNKLSTSLGIWKMKIVFTFFLLLFRTIWNVKRLLMLNWMKITTFLLRYYEMSWNRMIIITWVIDLHVIINRQNMRRLSNFDCGGLVQCDRWCVERNFQE